MKRCQLTGLAGLTPCVIQARCPDAARTCAEALEQARNDTAPCLRSAAGARAVLQAEGWADCPSWSALAAGARPAAPDADEAGLGDWMRLASWLAAARVADSQPLLLRLRAASGRGLAALPGRTAGSLRSANCPAATTPPAPAPRAKRLRRRKSTRLWPPNGRVRRPRSGVHARPAGSPGESCGACPVPGPASSVGVGRDPCKRQLR